MCDAKIRKEGTKIRKEWQLKNLLRHHKTE